MEGLIFGILRYLIHDDEERQKKYLARATKIRTSKVS